VNFKRLFKFTRENYFISIFIACILFVGFVSAYRIFFSKSTYVYAKVKMGQGLWWATTQKSPVWFVNAIKKGNVEGDLTGNPTAEILSVRYYPYYASGQYDVYLNVKLKVSSLGKSKKYSFKRSTIGVGSPIDFEFPTVQFSGTIIELSDKPIIDKYIEKTIYLTKKYAYPWEYDAIRVGDKYFDGEETVFEILDKTASDNNQIIATEFGKAVPGLTETTKYIILKAKIKAKDEAGKLVFGEDQIINTGRSLNISTANFTFTDYFVGGIE